MSKRTFIFCDACNPQGIRTENKGFLYSRRTCDVRSWYEGEETDALKICWIKTDEGLNLCPKCQRNGLGELARHKKEDLTRRTVSLARKT